MTVSTTPDATSPAPHGTESPYASSLRSSAEVVVVGAGLAGLACAKHLSAAGLDVLVVEAAEAVGGRVRSETVGGFRVDRGFQLLNPGYPEVLKVLDLDALDLQPFDAGVAVHRGGRVSVVRDPRRHPTAVLEALRFPLGTVKEKAALARWIVKVTSAGELKGPDSGWSQGLDAAEVHGELRWSVLEPFLAGVLGEVDGTTSRRFVDLLVRSFLRATPALPARGVQAVPDQLAAGLPAGSVVLGTKVRHIGFAPRSLVVETVAGGVNCQRIVVATDAHTAAHLVPELRVPDSHGLSTFWFAAPTSPAPESRERLLHLDGDRSGPVVNSAVVSAVAPGYVVDGTDRRALVSAQTLGTDTGAEAERRVREQLGRVYGVGTAGWELVAAHEVPHALPVVAPPFEGPQPVDAGDGVFVAGDHRENSSQQGALVSGRRAADAVLSDVFGRSGSRRAG
ncbi:glycine/D-amino acid oxidase-like deaminating enzyme [Kineococcus radiotolerans]|uniref:Amine oxidase n=2 Tax=Kineococcus radiotolerans TaxID=131568 RepID=A6WD57_KINRD|nr:NAD(P)/FAD-dependent oxidoreductase [Kineococcus radiotolerans]ABS04746.1 amine oxidase [Kineococcus radiotolerans SRS30216 = ATCC BAA-149]MBB2901588.1 glycine/D-amino acid oxidase-like deaminating enzyme [Kineococcus radiotolerans]